MPEEFDLGSSMEETFNELSGGGDAGDSGAPPSPSEPAASPPLSPAAESPATVSAAPAPQPWDSMPKSWKKDYEPKWGGIDPEVRKNIYEREKQALDGIMQYKSTADKWSKTMEPYKQWFDHYGIDPHDAFSRLATSHIILKYGKPEDRARWAQQLIQDYGLAEILNGSATGQQPGGVSPAQPNQSSEQVWQLQQRLDAVQKQMYDNQLKENMSAVEKFFSDPANEYAADLQEDILKMFEQGRASTLQEAYEQAMWLNPSVRKKLMDKEVAAATRPPSKAPLNVKSSSVAPAPTEEVEDSIEETMRATLQRMQSR